jgi:integrase
MGRRSRGITCCTDGSKVVDRVYKGKRIYARLGKVAIEEAEKFLASAIAEIEAGRGGRERTFREGGIRYIEHLEQQGARRVEDVARHLMVLDPWIGHLKLREVCDDALTKFIKSEHMKELSPTTTKRRLEVVRRVLVLASRSWRDEGVPWLRYAAPIISMPTLNPRKPSPLSWDEERRIVSRLPRLNADMLVFSANTGTREQDVCGLCWAWEQWVPELARSVFVIPGSLVKNGEDRLIVLNRIAQSIVESRRGMHEEFVFSYRGNQLRSMHNSAYQRARREEGLSHVRVHDWKHTFGRRLRAAGVSLEDRQVLLGHKNGSVTTHYSIPELKSLVEAADSVLSTRDTTILTVSEVLQRKVTQNSRSTIAGPQNIKSQSM